MTTADEQAIELLAQLVAWYGEEDNDAYCNRLAKAGRLVKKAAPDYFKGQMKKVRAQYE